LFDGESALKSHKAKHLVQQKYNIQLLAVAKYKRNLAERYVREIKLRTSLALDNEGWRLNRWKNVLPQVLSTLNGKQSTPSTWQQLSQFFTRTTYTVPQSQPDLYRFSIGDQVRTDLSRHQRRQLTFKYSLHFGKVYKRLLQKQNNGMGLVFR